MRLHSVFHVLDEAQVKSLSLQKSCAVYKKGQYIFNEGGIPSGLFCVNSGKIKLAIVGYDGKEQILRLAKAGDILGYRALISNERYHSSAIALEDTSLCIIDKQYFFSQLEQEPKLMLEVARKMSADLKKAEEHIVSLSQKNVRERLAEALLFLKATYGLQDDKSTINVKLTREEIADYIGTSTESCIRLLSEFNQDGIIELHGKSIKIINLSLLIRTANIED
ncbi:MAG: Crp/Fnr family transcriptional regulator [Chitinophagaceae bacterium]|nr:Crp/Fnr family transcriptional regulator [Chitinophagaceae bacterium]MCA6446832.1 Crp/Fnr family transcriptional regulator [Chitinophagaceae bacterium]